MADPLPKRIWIQLPAPAVDDGRFPAKRSVGDLITVEADVFRDGHDLLRAVVRYRRPGGSRWHETEMVRIDAHLGGVRWGTEFSVDEIGRWEYTIEAWTDAFGTWRDELARKVAAGQHDLAGELSEGIVLLHDAAHRAESDDDRAVIEQAIQTLRGNGIPDGARYEAALDPNLFEVVERTQERHGAVTLKRPLNLEVDRVRARFGSWYELFPRSWGGIGGSSSSFHASPSSASTCSTCRQSIRSGTPTAKAATTP